MSTTPQTTPKAKWSNKSPYIAGSGLVVEDTISDGGETRNAKPKRPSEEAEVRGGGPLRAARGGGGAVAQGPEPVAREGLRRGAGESTRTGGGLWDLEIPTLVERDFVGFYINK